MAQWGVDFAFVAAKLARPHVGRVEVRPETLAAFRQAATRRLTLICAPAGYGKTTTASHLIDRLGLEAVWYKLDVLDHDPAVFIVSLTHALRQRSPAFGELLLERARASVEAPFSLEQMTVMFVTECTDKVDQVLHIVLDDYQEAADSSALNWTLDYLLDNLPSCFRFVVLSRYDAAFSVSKLKLAGEVCLLGVDLLRFDPRQTAAVLGLRTSRTPPPAAVDRLVKLTEGWPASVVLASFALEWLGFDSIEKALSDPHLKQDIYSYLAEQVYLREDEAVRRFLKRTCCLEHITGELGNLLAGIENAQQQLDQLAAKRVFTFASGKEGTYRYHNLFRDYLRQRFLHEHGAAAFHGLQLRTIDALEECREIELAVDLSLTINEPARALDIIARTSEPGFDNIRSESLQSWVPRLEWSTAASSPWTGLLRSQVQLRAEDIDAALAQTEVTVAEFATPADGLGLYHAHSARECALFWSGDMHGATAACLLALDHAETAAQKAHTLISLGSAALDIRDWDRTEAAFAEAERLIVGIESPDHQRLRTLNALTKYFRGNVRAAHREMQPAIACDGPPGHRASVLNSLGTMEFALADYASAKLHFVEALEAAEQFGSLHLRPVIQDCLGFCLAATGEAEAGLELLHQSAAASTTQTDSAVLALSLSHIGTVHRRAQHLRDSVHFYEQACATVETGRDPYVELNSAVNLALARGLLGDDTIAALRSLSAQALHAGVRFVAQKAILFSGMVLISHGRLEEARPRLGRAVPELLRLGQLSLLVQEAKSDPNLVPHVVAAITDTGIAETYAQTVGHHLPKQTTRQGGSCAAPISGSLVGHLTARELQVLSLMASGARNPDIAIALYVSVATVKTHINHIFTKLGVSDRVQAILAYNEATSRSTRSGADA